MRNILLIIIFALLSFIASSQNYLPYYNLVNKAQMATFKKNYTKANRLYQRAFMRVKIPHAWDYRNAARNASRMNDANLALKYYLQAANLGFDLDELFQKEDSLALGCRIAEVKQHKYISPMCSTIDSLCQQDQFYRRKDYDNNWKKQNVIDSTNIVKIYEIRRTIGKIPGIKELGYSRTKHFTIIFCHTQPNQLFDSLASILLRQVVMGDFIPNSITSSLDKIASCDADRPYAFTRSIFGTALSFSTKENVHWIIPVRNYKYLNKLRKSVGLPTIEQSLLLSENKTVYNEELVRRNYSKMFMETPPRKPLIDCDGNWMKYGTNN